jgi:signal transduction histidine kinase/DNA-binding response OmpR family regulator
VPGLIRDPFDLDSEVARDLRRVDWSATPLGPPQQWPQSLQTVVRTVLASRFSMWMFWGPGLTFFCNDAYRRDTLGKKYPWALGRSAREVWAEIWDDIGPRIQTVLDSGTATWDEALQLFLERSGFPEETYHTFSYSPLADDNGDIVGMLCVVTEETERVIAEKRMRVLRDLGSAASIRDEPSFFAAVSRHLGADPGTLPFTLTYLYDADGATAALAGSTGVDVGHRLAPTVIATDDESAPWPAGAMLGGESMLIDLSADDDVPTGAWDEPPLEALVVPLPQQGQDRPLGFFVVGVNRYRPLDDDYRGFIDLIAGQVAAGVASARAYEAERQRADALAELDQAKTAFFTNISHEFRTPLTLLLGPAEDALADPEAPLAERQRERVEIVHRNGQRLLRLVNALLDFSRLESGRLTARFEPVDLGHETAELAGAFSAAVERVGLTLTIDVDVVREPVYLDREMWAKVVLNLLSNALKFTFTGGITVTVRDANGHAEVAVTDTGTGIDPAEQEHLFERFHRIAGAQSRTHEGSGIGLALVAELAALHGGSVTVDSMPGRGSTFTVSLPYGSDHLPSDQVAEPSEGTDLDAGRVAQGFLSEAMRWTQPEEVASAAAAAHADDRPRLLVVDDNADMRDYVIRLLRDSYDVAVAADGVAALEVAREQTPDLVLTDVMMPRLDGFGLLRALRDDPRLAHIPVVMLSARAGADATVEGLDAGADDYLIKPFTARELLARVRANLELDRVRRNRAHLERNQMLLDEAQRLAAVGSWELDLATGRVTGSEQFYRLFGVDSSYFSQVPFADAVSELVHPDDTQRVRDSFERAAQIGALDYTARAVLRDGRQRTFHVLGTLERDSDGTAVRLRGSCQDVTEQLAAQDAVAAAAAAAEAASREHLIADELQRSLLPPLAFNPDHLQVSTYYRAGVEGTHVGGDWYDVIELGAGRTALVIGDVMGRGVQAAAVMGQLRAAVRAYARLDLPPADVLEFLDGVVRDLGGDHIVTCLYAVYDPGERSLSFANAGHLPPLLVEPGGLPRRLGQSAAPPLGTGLMALVEQRVELVPGSVLVLYTDGLVEHRGTDIDVGIESLSAALETIDASLEQLPSALVAALLPDEPDDDIAVLVARVLSSVVEARSAHQAIRDEQQAVAEARHFVADTLREWDITESLIDDVVLLVSELVTNALIHGRGPVELRIRMSGDILILEVRDTASYLPRRLRPTVDDEHGRGLQLVAMLAERWGTRPTRDGKAVWCVFSTTRHSSYPTPTPPSPTLVE